MPTQERKAAPEPVMREHEDAPRVRIGEEQYRAALRDHTCVVCGRPRPLLTWGWVTCETCTAQHCRGCKKVTKEIGFVSSTISWRCKYCLHHHETTYTSTA